MSPNVQVVNIKFNPARIRSRLSRLPLFTRVIFFFIVAVWCLQLFLPWVIPWGALVPSEVDIWHMYRLNTYPIVHIGFFHALLSLIALVPLLERFEAEHGTLVSLILFTGPFSTLPGFMYILIDHVIFRGNASIQGAGVWVFLLLSCEALKLHRANPSFRLGQAHIPVWPYPLALLLLLHFLLPSHLSTTDSLLLNLSGSLIGYLFELSYLRLLIPPERILRFIEGKLNLLGRLPHYVSVDQKTYGRYGVLPTSHHEVGGVGGGGEERAGVRTPSRGLVLGEVAAARD